MRDEDGYRMWYGVRTKSRGYHAGYAESTDGVDWRRRGQSWRKRKPGERKEREFRIDSIH